MFIIESCSFRFSYYLWMNLWLNSSMDLHSNTTNASGPVADELKFGILKICLFSTFFILGLVGNSLVLIGIGLNKGMQTSTNLLIFNLALADVLFIIVCIPTTLFSFFGRWPFADFGCKLGKEYRTLPWRFHFPFQHNLSIISRLLWVFIYWYSCPLIDISLLSMPLIPFLIIEQRKILPNPSCKNDVLLNFNRTQSSIWYF